MLEKSPFNDGLHYEFHVFDNDVLVVYLKREQRRVIRMVGVSTTSRFRPYSRRVSAAWVSGAFLDAADVSGRQLAICVAKSGEILPGNGRVRPKRAQR